ncbi:cyclin-dependent kinase 2-associated protein 2 [Sceloporus undulatus]|uniref:cyclin-dependent kinase 2-associated protein 2 n=1 Tax=Sceloporus undulatus TaxID=8520 RepID=UPI001C4B2EA2|nr:cyclin-dependent kinase 2-associated protein 2 [Sceloporus undulatus]
MSYKPIAPAPAASSAAPSAAASASAPAGTTTTTGSSGSSSSASPAPGGPPLEACALVLHTTRNEKKDFYPEYIDFQLCGSKHHDLLVALQPRVSHLHLDLCLEHQPPFRPLFNDFGPPSMGYVQAMKPPGAQGSQSTYTDLLSVIEEMGKEIRPTYAGSKSAMERLKRGIIHARALVRECLAETERNART